MLHCIQIFMNTCEVTMQVKWAIGKPVLHKLPLYYDSMYLCWISILFGMICLFSNYRSFTTRFQSWHMFYLRCECATFLCARTSRNTSTSKRKWPSSYECRIIWKSFQIMQDSISVKSFSARSGARFPLSLCSCDQHSDGARKSNGIRRMALKKVK